MLAQHARKPVVRDTAGEVMHGESVDVAEASTVKISGACVMHGMGAPLKIIRSERQYAYDPTGPIICLAMPEEGPVAAIVLDHEEAH